MCGIAGIISARCGSIAPAVLDRLGACLAHRGPDGRGVLAWGPQAPAALAPSAADLPPAAFAAARAALVHRRLSILDLSQAAAQPMSTHDGRWHIVFNGEIYNYLELRKELQALGHSFRSTGDTEVLLQAWAQWGPRVLPRLTGMFALAVLDVRDHKLFLARDPFGIKPLYYAPLDGGLAFASEIKALLELPGMARRADPQSVYDYLRFGMTQHRTQTMFQGVQQFPAAHWAQVSLDGPFDVRPQPYWRLVVNPPRQIGMAEAAEQLRQLFLDNIRLHLRGDVPLGLALSGGIDSSAILGTARQTQGDAASLEAFCYAAPGTLNEEGHANRMAQRVHARMHVCRPTEQELLADIDAVILAQDEPFGSLSIYGQYRLFRLAREQGVKVLLGGQGADEMLAGYRPHLASRLVSMLCVGDWAGAIRLLKACASLPGASPARTLARAVGLMLPAGAGSILRPLAGESLLPRWMNRDWFAATDTASRPRWASAGKQTLRQHLAESLAVKSLPALLRYEDRNSMAWSIESRVPFLTPALAELVLSLPEDLLIGPGGESKAVFRKAMEGIVAPEILARRDKIGFAAPNESWMLGVESWVQKVLDDTPPRHSPVNVGRVTAMWRQVQRKRRPLDLCLWRCLNLLRWSQLTRVKLDP